jgi:hypothetical protein
MSKPLDSVDFIEAKNLVSRAIEAGLIKPAPEDFEDARCFVDPLRICPVCDHRTRLPVAREIRRGRFYGCIYWTCEKCGAEHLGEGSLIK